MLNGYYKRIYILNNWFNILQKEHPSQWKSEYDDLLNDHTSRHIPIELTKKKLRDKFTYENIGTHKIYFNCPKSGERIRIPAIYESCEHLQCFDLEFFLRECRSYLKCPIEECPIEIKEIDLGLRINEFFADILYCHPDETETEIVCDGKDIQIGQFIIPEKIDVGNQNKEENEDEKKKDKKTSCVVKHNANLTPNGTNDCSSVIANDALDANISCQPKKRKFCDAPGMTNINSLDIYTMLKVFKYLDYCELAKSSRVSKKFYNIIRAHRKSLARLTVESVIMTMKTSCRSTFFLQTFNKLLSPSAYKEWILRNQYLDQVQFYAQFAGEQIIEYDDKMDQRYLKEYKGIHFFTAEVNYKYPNFGDNTKVFHARIPLQHIHKNVALLQHFVRLLTDPNIYINYLQLDPQNDVLTLLDKTIGNRDRNRLHCKVLEVYPNVDIYPFTPNLISWAKNNVCCNELNIEYHFGDHLTRTHDQMLLDLFMNGSHMTSAINTFIYDLSNVVVDFVQNFMDLQQSDDHQIVQHIHGNRSLQIAVAKLKSKYVECVVMEEIDACEDTSEYVFEFVNSNIAKKLQLTGTVVNGDNLAHFYMIKSEFSLNITDL
ncbi:MIZ/SP-RING zinc finger domain-containing protein [Ditylenchus destructor]|nr:MIZ/SP-RING zinc finger domain-containing protein [Ditylenchus destructor]